MTTPDPSALRHQAERLLQAHALEDADPSALVAVLGRARIAHVSTGETLCREYDPGDEVYFLIEGRIRVLKKDHEGRERDIGTWFAPAMVGAVTAAAPGSGVRRTATCIAGAPSTVAVLDARQTRELLDDPGPEGATLRWIMLSSFTETLGNVTDRLRDLLGKPANADLTKVQAALQGLKP